MYGIGYGIRTVVVLLGSVIAVWGQSSSDQLPLPERLGIAALIDKNDAEFASASKLVNRRDQAAREVALRLVRRLPYSLWGWRLYAQAIHQSEAYSELESTITSAKGLHPAGAACYARAYLLFLRTQYGESYEGLERCDPVVARHPLARNLRAFLLGERGDNELSFKLLQELIEEYPEMETARNALRWRVSQYLGKKVAAALDKPVALRTQEENALRKQARALVNKFKGLDNVVVRFTRNRRIKPLGIVSVTANDVCDTFVYRAGNTQAYVFNDYQVMGSTYEHALVEVPTASLTLFHYQSATGSHHFRERVLVIPEQHEPSSIVHEWQDSEPIRVVDLDRDGVPELVQDYSDHYVLGYATGIKNFNYYVLRFDRPSGRYVYQRFNAPEIRVSKEVTLASAEGLEHAARGRWALALASFRKAVVGAPESVNLHWNYLLVQEHLRRLQSQYKASPSVITALLTGDPTLVALYREPIEPISNALPLINLYYGALDGMPSALNVVSSQIYRRGRAFEDLVSQSGLSPFTQKRILPELRAYENAIVAKRRQAMFYAEPGTPPSVLAKAFQEAAPHQAEYIFAPVALKRIGIERSASAVSYIMSPTDTPEQLLTDVAKRIKLEDYDRALTGLSNFRVRFANDPRYVDTLKALERLVDIRRGRSYSALESLQNSRSPTPDDFEVYEQLGLFDDAERAYLEFGNRCPDESECISAKLGAGRAAYALGKFSEAATRFSSAKADLEQLMQGYNDPRYPAALSLLAKTYARSGDTDSARAMNALAHFAHVRSLDAGSGWIQSSFYYRYPMLARLLTVDFEIAAARHDRASAIGYISAALSVVRDLAFVADASAARTEPESVDSVKKAPEDDSPISRFMIAQSLQEVLESATEYFCNSGDAFDALVAINQLKDTTATRRALRVTERSAVRPAFTEIQMHDLLKRLAMERTAVIQYSASSEVVHAVVVPVDHSNGPRLNKLPVTRHELRMQVDDLLDDMTGPDSEARTDRAEQRLRAIYRNVIEPLEDQLGGAKSVLIIPDDALYRLPFAALTSERGQRLVQRWSLGFAPSLQSLLTGRKLPAVLNRVLVAHSPITSRAQRLTSGTAELASIRQLLPKAEVSDLGGSNLTKAALAKSSREAELIHFSTHAIMDTTQPDQSYLLLREGEQTDEVLSLGDLLRGQLLFQRSPVVVLASCSSGAGRTFVEGLMGFAYGLTVAGASASIMTYWEISDEAGAAFSQQLYTALANNVDPVEAVASAQRSLIGKTRVADWAAYMAYRSY